MTGIVVVLFFNVQYEAIGGQTLTILHEETLHYITDNNAQKLCMHLTEKAADPYFDSLQRWLHKGIVFDPYSEVTLATTSYQTKTILVHSKKHNINK